MFTKILVAAAGSMITLSAFALDSIDMEKCVALKDGSTAHVFKDGKMAMQNSVGRPVRMDPGTAMQTKDGQKIAMQGDRVARLGQILSDKWHN